MNWGRTLNILPTLLILLFVILFGLLLYSYRWERKRGQELQTVAWNIIEEVRLAIGHATLSQLSLKERVDWKKCTLNTQRLSCMIFWPTALTLSASDANAGFTRNIDGRAMVQNGTTYTFEIFQGAESGQKSRHHHRVRYDIKVATEGEVGSTIEGVGHLHEGSTMWPIVEESLDKIFHEVEARAKAYSMNTLR